VIGRERPDPDADGARRPAQPFFQPPRRGRIVREDRRGAARVAYPDGVVAVDLDQRPRLVAARSRRQPDERAPEIVREPTDQRGDPGRRGRAGRAPGRARVRPGPFDAREIRRPVAAHDVHRRRAHHVARDADLVGRGRGQPEGSRFRRRPPRGFVRGQRSGGDRDHVGVVVARDCFSAAARKCRMYCTPEYSDTTVEKYSSHSPAIW